MLRAILFFFFSSRRRHTRFKCDWSSDVCSSDLTTAANLRAMGAQVEEFEDGLRVDGPTKLRGARIDPHGDHRIAMAFTVAALLAEGETEIDNDECVEVSFPEFFNLLNSIVER